MHAVLIALTTAIVLGGPQQQQQPLQRPPLQRPAMSLSSNALTIPGCVVTLIDDVPIPALEAGQLTELKVREGEQVKAGQVLAQIDDSQVRKAEEVTRYELEAAKVEANNDVDVRYARASREVDEVNLRKAQEANNKVPGAVPDIELRKFWLDLQKSTLGIEQASHNLEVAHYKVSVNDAKHSAAKLDIERRQVKTLTDGIVVKQFAHVGEWLKPGDPVVRLVRMDKLWIEGLVDATGANGVAPAEVDGRPVTVKVALARNQEAVLHGKIVFVSPVVEAGPVFPVKAEVINEKRNGYWILQPGLNADMTIELGR